jgi:CcmD family protein
MRIRRVLAAFATMAAALMLTLAPALALAVQPPPGQTEFVPAKDLPPTESIPAAPLLVTAYAFIWVAVAFYLWTIWRRLNKVESEMRALARKIPPR